MTNALAAFNARAANGLDAFAADLCEIAGITDEQARRVSAYYRKHKMAKLDRGIGRVIVKHGAFLDRAVILRAAKEA